MTPTPDLVTATDLTGLVRLRQDLLADGWTSQQITRAHRAGAITRIRHGAYVDSLVWSSLSPADQHRTRARALLRTAHSDTVLTHVSSVVEHGAPVWGLPLDILHTSRTSPRKAGRRQCDWVPHRGLLDAEDVVELNGVRVSKAVRAAVELTTLAGVEESLVSVNAMLNEGRFTPQQLHAFAQDVAKYWPRSLTTDLVVRLADPRVSSVGESRTSYLCWRHGLPKPEAQVTIRDETGEVFAFVDFAWPERGVFLEFDGQEKYRLHRRPGETLEQYVLREKRREERICALTGWVCIRMTWADLAAPERTAARIRRLLEIHSPKAV